MIYYTADLHFGHKNVIKYDGRPFADVEEMDQVLINNWNARVHNEDDVYLIGDLCYCSKKPPEWYLRQLKGRKHLIVGNHDQVTIAHEDARNQFESIDWLRKIEDGDKKIILCHYPIAEWEGYYKGFWHIYGHIHNKMDSDTGKYILTREHSLNAGCMLNGYMPVTFNELVANNTFID